MEICGVIWLGIFTHQCFVFVFSPSRLNLNMSFVYRQAADGFPIILDLFAKFRIALALCKINLYNK